jgi:hypothetical protein
VSRRYWPTRSEVSGDASGNRLRSPDHAVERLGGRGDSTLLGRQEAGAQLRADNRLVSADRGVRETAPAVAGCLLPGHAALRDDEPDVAIVLALRLVSSVLGTVDARGGMIMSGSGSGWCLTRLKQCACATP